MKKDEHHEQLQQQVHGIDSDKTWTWKLYGFVNVPGQSKLNSKTQNCSSVLFIYRNVS